MRRWTWIYGAVVLLFTVYTLLDTFVITRVYTVVEEEEEPEEPEESEETVVVPPTEESEESTTATQMLETQESTEPMITDTSYQDEDISITIQEYRVYDTTIYVADVQVSSADALKTAFAENAYGKNVTDSTSQIAEDAGAILAINGDFYGARNRGYVLRNGVLYRESGSDDQEDLVIYEDGSFQIINEGSISAEALLEAGAEQVLSFGPALLVDGQIQVSEDDEVGRAMASNPRTAIAVVDELHYLFVVSDGRTDESEGLSLYQMATVLKDLGAETAYNLDGGGSSTMVFNGTVINNPTSNGRNEKERSVSDIVYIG